MGRHVLMGERPIFFYGQAYMGSLDAYLVALFFLIFGQAVWVVRLVQTLLFMGTILTTFYLAKSIFGEVKIGLISAALMAVPVLNVTLYTTVSLGGYGEALLLGNLILLIAISISHDIDKHKTSNPQSQDLRFILRQTARTFFVKEVILGFLIGLGLWANGLTLVYSAPAVLYLLVKALARSGENLKNTIFLKTYFSGFGFSFLGFTVGSLPIWIFVYQSGFTRLFSEYLGSAVSVESGSWVVQVFQHLINFFLLGIPAAFGFRPPWDVRWLVLPLIPFILFFWIWVLLSTIRIIIKKQENWAEILLICSPMILVFCGFLGTSFGIDPSGRYFLPFSITFSLLGAVQITRKWYWSNKVGWGLVALLLFFNLGGTVQSIVNTPHGFTTQFDSTTIIDHQYDQQLIAFLEENHETRGYCNYWTSYPLAFLSQENLIFVPQLPYHYDFRYTPRDDRYSPYDLVVANSDKVAYITVHFPALDNLLRSTFKQAGVSWKEESIGDYRVFYDLSKPIRPADINFTEKRS